MVGACNSSAETWETQTAASPGDCSASDGAPSHAHVVLAPPSASSSRCPRTGSDRAPEVPEPSPRGACAESSRCQPRCRTKKKQEQVPVHPHVFPRNGGPIGQRAHNRDPRRPSRPPPFAMTGSDDFPPRSMRNRASWLLRCPLTALPRVVARAPFARRNPKGKSADRLADSRDDDSPTTLIEHSARLTVGYPADIITSRSSARPWCMAGCGRPPRIRLDHQSRRNRTK
jgi:hypothetical protein